MPFESFHPNPSLARVSLDLELNLVTNSNSSLFRVSLLLGYNLCLGIFSGKLHYECPINFCECIPIIGSSKLHFVKLHANVLDFLKGQKKEVVLQDNFNLIRARN